MQLARTYVSDVTRNHSEFRNRSIRCHAGASDPMTKASVSVGGDSSSPAAAASGIPVDPGSDSDDSDHPLQEPQYVIHAVDDERGQQPPLLPVHQLDPAAANNDRNRRERLRCFMIAPQAFLCCMTLMYRIMLIYFAKNPEERRDLNWDVFVIVCSALFMFLSMASVLISYLGVYCYDGWAPILNQWLPPPYYI